VVGVEAKGGHQFSSSRVYERRCRRIRADCLDQRLLRSIENASKAIQLVSKPNATALARHTNVILGGLTDPQTPLKTHHRNDTLPSAS
jgi:hypothetical protein